MKNMNEEKQMLDLQWDSSGFLDIILQKQPLSQWYTSLVTWMISV